MADDLVGQCAGEDFAPARLGGFADDDFGEAVAGGVGDDVVRRVLALQGFDFAAHALGEAQGALHGFVAFAAEADMAVGFDVERRPRGFEAAGHALGYANKFYGECVWADADEDAICTAPALRAAVAGFVHVHERVHALGGAAQGEFAQGDEVALFEEILRGAFFRFRRDIDLAFFQAFEQFFGGDVHQRDFVRLVEDGVRHGFLHPHAGDTRDHIVQAF